MFGKREEVVLLIIGIKIPGDTGPLNGFLVSRDIGGCTVNHIAVDRCSRVRSQLEGIH
jgi:hypothetical protein